MSMSIEQILKKMPFIVVPAALAAGTVAAVVFSTLRPGPEFVAGMRAPAFPYYMPGKEKGQKDAVTYDRTISRDIFMQEEVALPAEETEETAPVTVQKINLSMVIAGGSLKYCLTNGRMLREGEKIGGILVKKIFENSVLYSVHDGNNEVRLNVGETVAVASDGTYVQPGEPGYVVKEVSADVDEPPK